MISEPKRHHVTVTFHTRGCTCLRAMSKIGAPVSGARSYECSGPKAIRTFAGGYRTDHAFDAIPDRNNEGTEG